MISNTLLTFDFYSTLSDFGQLGNLTAFGALESRRSIACMVLTEEPALVGTPAVSLCGTLRLTLRPLRLGVLYYRKGRKERAKNRKGIQGRSKQKPDRQEGLI
jgi:hypothetical protein